MVSSVAEIYGPPRTSEVYSQKSLTGGNAPFSDTSALPESPCKRTVSTLGGVGRRLESSRPDQIKQQLNSTCPLAIAARVSHGQAAHVCGGIQPLNAILPFALAYVGGTMSECICFRRTIVLNFWLVRS